MTPMGNGKPSVEVIEAMLEDGHPEEALALAEQALKIDPDSAEIYSLVGWALWDLGDPAGAGTAYQKALGFEPNSSDLLLALAETRFALLDLEGAESHARRALAEERSAEAFELLSRIAERNGQDAEAEELMKKAHAIEPDDFPMPYRVSDQDFMASADEALAELPETFIAAMKEHLTLMIEPLPPREVLVEDDPPLDPGILGLYTGIPLPDRESSRSSGNLPDRVYLFQKNLERIAEDRETLVREIAITLYHEIGHFLGMSEEDLEELDFG